MSFAKVNGIALANIAKFSGTAKANVAKVNGIAQGGSNGLLTNLIAYWKMDEASGNAVDASGGNTGVETGGTIGSATGLVYPTVRKFVGSDSRYFLVSNNSNIRLGYIDFTYAGWFYVGASEAYPVIFSKGPLSDPTAILYQSGTSLTFELLNSGNAVSASFTLSAWQFYVAYYDSSNNIMGLQINNGTASTRSYSAMSDPSGYDLQIGARSSQSLYWNNSLGPLMFWKRLLSAGDITNLYNSGSGLPYSSFT